MKIKIDTDNKTVTVLEEISIADLTNQLEVLLQEDYHRYKIIPPPIEYHPYIPSYTEHPVTYRQDTTEPSPHPNIFT